MQRVTNCLLKDHDKVLLLKKPRRGWYAMPGGKMEYGESIQEAAIREFREETGLELVNPELYSVATMVKKLDANVSDEWMMFTFVCDWYEGTLVDFCKEGELQWVPISSLATLPIAPSDRYIHEYLLRRERLYASFELDQQDQLINYRLK